MSKFTMTREGAKRSMRGSPVLANCVEAALTADGAGPALMLMQGQVPEHIVALAFARRETSADPCG